MPIKVLMADDSDLIRAAMRRVLQEEPEIEIVGEAASFAEAMQMIAALKPRVLVLDLSLPERQLTPEFVKTQLQSVGCTVAVSFANDDEAKALAESYGATLLLDKMRLYDEIIPAIKRCPDESE